MKTIGDNSMNRNCSIYRTIIAIAAML